MVCIIDYGIGNLRSIEKAFQAFGADVIRSDQAADIERASHVVLPGVGAFGACADEILRRELNEPIREAMASGKPFLGVCVGMQLLFEYSEEMGQHEGFGTMKGRITRFAADLVPAGAFPDDAPPRTLKVPHMGWNTVRPQRPSPLLKGLPNAPFFYFVHSYYAEAEDPSDVLGSADYGVSFPAIVERNNVFGVQFHPEKSQANGLRILENFTTLPPR